MAFDYQDTFQRIVAKASLLAQKYNLLAESKAAADQRIKELEQIVANRELQINTLSKEVESLRTAATIAPSREQITATRALISDLVRDIDRCIADLSD